MKITKILVALSFLFAVATANAGELSVTGSMEATYNSQGGSTTGNPLGTDRELKFSGSTELDNGITVSVMQDTNDSLGYGDNLITFGNVMGMVDIYVGADGGPVDAIDDITPSAYEEAWGSGAGTINDIGTGVAGQMGIGAKFAVPVLGAVNVKYVPRADSTENADNASSGDANGANATSAGSGESITIKTSFADIPGGESLAGLVLTTGYETVEVSGVANTADSTDATVALNYTYGQFAVGVQKKYHNEGETGTAADEIFYKDMAYGLSYAVNDNLSLSYNRYESYRHDQAKTAGTEEDEQVITAYNLGYTVGGMTIGFQEADTKNAGWVDDAKDDSRTLGISVAF
jgi:hypothetical protein